MKYFSIFSGIGGFDIPLLKHGWECVGHSEIDKYANQIYNKHFNNKNYGDATKIDPKNLPDIDMICGGFPCQSFSIAGNRGGIEYDTRGTLFKEIMRIAEEKRPGLIFLENVKGLLSSQEGWDFFVIQDSMVQLGYELEWEVLNTKNFGLPQNRERVFIIGHLGKIGRQKVFPIGQGNRIHKQEYKQQGEQISKFGENYTSAITKNYHKGVHCAGETYILHNIYGGFNEDKPRVFKDYSPAIRTPKGGGHLPVVVHNTMPRSGDPKKGGTGHLSKSDGTVYNIDTGNSNAVEIYDEWNKTTNKSVVGTITKNTGNKSRATGTFRVVEKGNVGEIKPTKTLINNSIRRLTPTECERLQGFEDGDTSGISDSQRYKCLGNAVSVPVINAIVEKINEIYH